MAASILCAPLVASAQADRFWYLPDVKDASLTEARELFLKGSVQASLEKLDSPDLAARLADDRTQEFQRHYMRALSLYELRRVNDALEATDKALRLGWKLESPDYAWLVILRAQLFLRAGGCSGRLFPVGSPDKLH